METEVYVQYSEPSIAHTAGIEELLWQCWFSGWLKALNPTISPINSYCLSLRLTDDAGIQTLNATYRTYDCPTDVLSFAALEAIGQESTPMHWQSDPVELGDIVISVETALRQASEHDHSLIQELAWLAGHGLLHLLGWDHPDSASLDKMLHQQDVLLRAVGLLDT